MTARAQNEWIRTLKVSNDTLQLVRAKKYSHNDSVHALTAYNIILATTILLGLAL